MAQSFRLSADDPRNPSYYERRAGYSVADNYFFENRRSDDQPRSKVRWSKENFVRGFDLTCGEFYRIREKTLQYLLLNVDYKSKLNDQKWELYEAYEWMEKHELLENKKVPAYWKRKMIQKFVSGLCGWLHQNNDLVDEEESELTNLPTDFSWKWGPDRRHQTFNGWFQSRHMIFIMHDTDSNSSCRIPVTSILEDVSEDEPLIHGIMDIDVNSMRFEILQQVLKKNIPSMNYSATTHSIGYSTSNTDSDWTYVRDDSTLRSALSVLKKKNSDEVQLEVKRGHFEVVSFHCLQMLSKCLLLIVSSPRLRLHQISSAVRVRKECHRERSSRRSLSIFEGWRCCIGDFPSSDHTAFGVVCWQHGT